MISKFQALSRAFKTGQIKTEIATIKKKQLRILN